MRAGALHTSGPRPDPTKSRHKDAGTINMEMRTGSLHSAAALYQQDSSTSQKSLCVWLLTGQPWAGLRSPPTLSLVLLTSLSYGSFLPVSIPLSILFFEKEWCL